MTQSRSSGRQHGDPLPNDGRYIDPPMVVRLTTEERQLLLALVKDYWLRVVEAAVVLDPTDARVERAEMCAAITLKLKGRA